MNSLVDRLIDGETFLPWNLTSNDYGEIVMQAIERGITVSGRVKMRADPQWMGRYSPFSPAGSAVHYDPARNEIRTIR